MTEEAWKFTTHNPNPLRMEENEMVYDPNENPLESAHRMGWITRRNVLKSGDISYQAKCKCKWKDKQDGMPKWVPKRLIHIRYAGHILRVKELERQAKQEAFDYD